MSEPKVLNMRGAFTHNLPESVYIGRGSSWGNPFRIGRDGTRDEVCDRFECEILPSLDVSPLRGQNLRCYCAPLRCHGDAILKKANDASHERRETTVPMTLPRRI